MQAAEPHREHGVTAGTDGALTRDDLTCVVAELDAVIADIESAPAGNRSLDARLHFGARVLAGHGRNIAGLLVDEGISWPTVEAALDETVPRYTTSLDAALEGERIVFVLRSAKHGRWVAMQTASGREIMGWAATEAMARRLVALKAWRTEMSAALAGEAVVRGTTRFGERGSTRPDTPDDSGAWRNVDPADKAVPPGSRNDKDWEVLF